MDEVLTGPVPQVVWVDEARADAGVMVRVPGWPGIRAGDTVHLAWGASIVDAAVTAEMLAPHGVGPVDVRVPSEAVYRAGDGHLMVLHRIRYADGHGSEWSVPTRTFVAAGTPDADQGRLLYPDGRQAYLNDDIPLDAAALGLAARLRIPGPFRPGELVDVEWTVFGPQGAVRTTRWQASVTSVARAVDAPVPAATVAWAAGRHVQFRHTVTEVGGWVRRSPVLALRVAPANRSV